MTTIPPLPDSPTITIRGKATKMRPMNPGFRHVIKTIEGIESLMVPNATAGLLILGYAAVYSLPPADAYAITKDPQKLEEAMGITDQELSNEDFRALDDYLAAALLHRQAVAAAAAESAAEAEPAAE